MSPSPRVLVVDDDPTTRRLLAHMLKRGGYDVTAVEDGRQALEALDQAGADLVVTDRNMPVVDGLALLKLVRASDAHRQVPLIMVTSSSDERDQPEAEAEGATVFLTKPVGSLELLTTVKRVLEGRRESSDQ
jgi:two-component system chemotaxis response regulator CheY